MIVYTTGDLLKSPAEALVNTVNCEGYMGKGIAYQFKQQFPQNNLDYVKACKNGSLKVGKLHYFIEKDKMIINFPTKDKWRANSKMEYVEDGLDELVELIHKLEIKSIAIPPLGSGNGGLNWSDVSLLIKHKLAVLPTDVEIYIYEPSINFVPQKTLEPKLDSTALVLMQLKKGLHDFDTFRLQMTAYFASVFSEQKIFRFRKNEKGISDTSITSISRSISAFQKYYNVKNTDEAYQILYKKIVSDKVENRLLELKNPIEKALSFVNSIGSSFELGCIVATLFFVQERKCAVQEEIINALINLPENKGVHYTEKDILHAIQVLFDADIIETSLTGYMVAS